MSRRPESPSQSPQQRVGSPSTSSPQQQPAPIARRNSELGERFNPNVNAINDAVAHANWAERKWVWIPDKDEGYIAAYIVREEGEKVIIKLASNEQLERTVHVNDAQKMNPPKFDKVEDMAALTYLNEASVIHNLRLRYFSNLIYVCSCSNFFF